MINCEEFRKDMLYFTMINTMFQLIKTNWRFLQYDESF